MTSVYDDVFYVETLKNMDDYQKEQEEHDNNEKETNCNCSRCLKEDHRDVIRIIEYIGEKKMFEKLLSETLEELNTTNPALEPGKYHMLCIYANRYNKFIARIENAILWYEWKRLRREKETVWSWSWKLMSYFIKREKGQETLFIEKNKMEKKKD
jgi:hypothetical protein